MCVVVGVCCSCGLLMCVVGFVWLYLFVVLCFCVLSCVVVFGVCCCGSLSLFCCCFVVVVMCCCCMFIVFGFVVVVCLSWYRC